MRITEIQIEGFRGINRPITLSLDRGMVVISGPNGAGKTSVFQAVEWCLFGKLDLSGIEFQREDAIVNDFHPGEEARVILTLDDGTVVTRTRNKKARTSFGAKHDSKLTVARDRKQLEDEEAQEAIAKLMALGADEFGAVVHLRQETIRDFIQGTPAQRSVTIDKMIGLFHLRELITGLDPKTIDKEIAELEKRMTGIDQTMIQATILGRAAVKDQEEALEKEGVTRGHISKAGAVSDLEVISSQLMDLATRLHVSVPSLGTLSVDTGRQVVAQAREAVENLAEQRFTEHSQLEESISRLTGLRSDLERAAKDLESLAGVDVRALKTQHDAAAARKGEFEAKLPTLNASSSRLAQLKHQIEAVQSALKEIQSRLKSLGSVGEAEAKLQETRGDIEEVAAAEKAERPLENLLPAAAEYLDASRPERCPVCQEAIRDLPATILRLREEIQASKEAQRIQQLESRYRVLQANERRQEQIILDIREAEKTLSLRQEETAKLRAELEKITGRPPTEPLGEFAAQELTVIVNEIGCLQQQISEAGIIVTTTEGQLRSLEEKQSQLQYSRQQVASALDMPVDTDDLITPLRESVQQCNERIEELKQLANAFPALNKANNRMERILDVLEARQRLSRLEKEFPTAVKEKEALQRTVTELNDLKLALQDIYQAAVEHQRSIVEGALAALAPAINVRYSRIISHPEYAELQIQPEEEKKGVYRYWIVARNTSRTHSTYITTRFSTSQRNVAAVAIFLAMADYLPHNLNVMMIDDPTQSLDPDHRKAMAQFFAEESAKKQAIIATEDPVFADAILQASANPLHHQLGPWTSQGITL